MLTVIGKLPLQTVMIVTFVVVVVVTGGFTGYLAFYNGQNAVNELASQLRAELMARIQQHLSSYLATPFLVNQLNLDGIRLGEIDSENENSLLQHFNAQLQRFESVVSIAYSDEDKHYVGIARVGVSGMTDPVHQFLAISNQATNFMLQEYKIDAQGHRVEQTYSSAPGYDPRTRPWYQAAVQAGDKPSWTPIFMWTQGAVGLDAVVSIHDKTNKLMGVLDTSLTLSAIGDFLQNLNVTQHGQTFIMERSGLLVASSTLKQPYIRTNNEIIRLSAIDSHESVIQSTTRYLEQRFGNLTAISSSQQVYYDLDGERQFVQVTPYQDQYGLNWLIVVVVPESDFMADIYNSNQNTLMLIAVSLVGAVATAILITRWVTVPILRLNQSARALAKGDWVQQVEMDRHDEVGELASSFNRMAEQLQASFVSLQLSEERYRNLFDRVPIGLYRSTPQGQILDANPTLAQMLGYPDLMAVKASDLYVNTEDRKLWQAQIELDGLVRDFVTRVRQYDGTIIWVSESSRIVRNVKGQVLYYEGSLEDITEHKNAENAELEQRALAEALRDTAAVLTGSLDLSEVMTRILQNVGRVVSHDAANIMLIEGNMARVVARQGYDDKPILSTLPLDTPHLDQMVSTGKPFLVANTATYSEWVNRPGSTWICSYAAAPISAHHKVVGFLNLDSTKPYFFTEDHIRRLQAFADQAAIAIENARLYDEVSRYANELEKRVEERTAQLNQAKERVEVILNNSSHVIILTGTDGTIRQTNLVSSQLLGYRSDELIGHTLLTLMHPDSKETLTNVLKTVLKMKHLMRFEVVVQGKNMISFDADAALSPILDESGQIADLVCSLRDITARKHLEKELRQMLTREIELGELKSRFVSMASHEFRTPLAVIQSTSDLLSRYSDKLSEERKHAEFSRIHRSVQNIVSLLDDVLTLNRVESGHLELAPGPLNLDTFCRDIVADFQQIAGVRPTITFSSTGECSHVVMDPKLLRHILVNLLSNAVKYSPSSSPVTFELICTADHAVFHITDQGIGIPEADQQRLFEAFHRAKNVGSVPGTGLGLAIVKQSVELHGGSITFHSKEGAGTTFTIEIPDLRPTDGDTRS